MLMLPIIAAGVVKDGAGVRDGADRCVLTITIAVGGPMSPVINLPHSLFRRAGVVSLCVALAAGGAIGAGCSGGGSDRTPRDSAASTSTARPGDGPDTAAGDRARPSEGIRVTSPDGRITAICMNDGEAFAHSSDSGTAGVLRFTFAGDTTIYRYQSEPGVENGCIDLSIFSPSGKWARLQSGASAPFEIVAADHLKEFLSGRAKADDVAGVRDTIEVVKGERTPVARVHDSFRWVGDSACTFAVRDADPVYYRHTIGGATVRMAKPPGSPSH